MYIINIIYLRCKTYIEYNVAAKHLFISFVNIIYSKEVNYLLRNMSFRSRILLPEKVNYLFRKYDLRSKILFVQRKLSICFENMIFRFKILVF